MIMCGEMSHQAAPLPDLCPASDAPDAHCIVSPAVHADWDAPGRAEVARAALILGGVDFEVSAGGICVPFCQWHSVAVPRSASL